MKRNALSRRVAVVLGVCLMLGLAVDAPAELIATIETSATEKNYAVSATDLVNAGQATLSSATFTDYVPSNANNGKTQFINDGLTNTQYQGILETDANLPWMVDFVLNTSDNVLGYDITRIDSMAGSGNRHGQGVTVSYSTVSAPDTFVELGSWTAYYASGAQAGSSLIRLTDDSTGVIVSGVKTVRLTYTGYATPGNPYYLAPIYEVDIFGTATSPPKGTVISLR